MRDGRETGTNAESRPFEEYDERRTSTYPIDANRSEADTSAQRQTFTANNERRKKRAMPDNGLSTDAQQSDARPGPEDRRIDKDANKWPIGLRSAEMFSDYLRRAYDMRRTA